MLRRSRSRPARAPARPNFSYAARIPTVCRAPRSDSRNLTDSVTSSHWLARARSTRMPQATEVLVPPITDRWEAVLDRAAEGWWGQLMLAIRSHARGDLEEARLGYLRSDQDQARRPGRPGVLPSSRSNAVITPAPQTCTHAAVAQAPT